MQNNDTKQMAQLERKVDYLIRYLGIDPACVANGVMPAGFPTGLPTGDGLPLSLDEVAPTDWPPAGPDRGTTDKESRRA
jgi:hypothetical protein